MRICVLHRPHRNVEWQTKFTGRELPDDSIEEARHHAAAIEACGHETEIITWSRSLRDDLERLKKGGYDLVVNASSLQEVAVLEFAGIRFMGSGLDLVVMDKATRKRLWIRDSVPTPTFMLVDELSELDGFQRPPFPLFVKPARGRGSAGITDESIVNAGVELERACRRIISTMNQGALVEKYISGTEVTVGLIGNGLDLTVLPPLEIEYNGSKTNTFEHKQDREVFHCPPRLAPDILERLRETARLAFMSVGARDFARVDFIYDHERDIPYVLEINTFAGLQILDGRQKHLHSSYIGKMAETVGWDSAEVFRRLIEVTMKRYEQEESAEGLAPRVG
ncbi:MAG TPA: ATP-grasp domain-containing protein [Bacillota bacterium]